MIQNKGVHVGGSSGGGAAGSIVIGNPVTGGGANRVLYEDGSQNLAAASNFTFASNVLTCPTITATTQFTTGTFFIQAYSGGANFVENGAYSVSIFSDNLRLRASAAIGFDPGTTAYGGTLDLKLTRYASKQLMISGDGTGATTNAGWILGYGGTSGYSMLVGSGTGAAASITNYNLFSVGTATYLGAPATGQIIIAKPGHASDLITINATAGAGPAITAGTATTDVNALSITQTFNAGGTTFTGIKANFTDTASAAGTLLMDLQVGAASKFNVSKAGLITTNSATMIASNQAFTDGAAAQAGTLTNAPAAGNPTKWIPINDNGTTRYLPAW